MSTTERPFLPFSENTDLKDAQFPWLSFDDVADKVYAVADLSLEQMKQACEAPIQPNEITMDSKTAEIAFAQRVLAFVKRCDEISWEFVEDGEKYHTVRHSMALRVIGLYYDTQHYIDAKTELSFLRRELAITPDDPLIHYVNSAYERLHSIPQQHSEPPKEISYMQLSLLDQQNTPG